MDRARRRLGQALVIYADDVDRIERSLDEYRKASQAQCSLLVDLSGHLVTHRGSLEGVDLDALGALLAGSFLAIREVARALGEEDFTTLVHQGKDENVQLSLVDDRTLLATVHAPQHHGLVAFFVGSAVARIRAVLSDAWERARPVVQPSSDVPPGFTDEIGKAFDGLLGT